MAASPQWKVYRNGEYVAACKYAEDAAALVALSGGVIKHGHSSIVWREGSEEFEAGESYDRAAEVMQARCFENSLKSYQAIHGGTTD